MLSLGEILMLSACGGIPQNTLAGVDANGDGVRDDVEVQLVNYVQNDTKRLAAMRQAAVAIQNLIVLLKELMWL